MKLLSKVLAFEWDEANRQKNVAKHRVSNEECEEVFFDPRKKIAKDIFHSDRELRYILIGATRNERYLFIVFTVRKTKIRVVSARDLNCKEYYLYEEKTQTS